jgi:Raf kinase inhibitor-like YbhB/YbcL family protein
LGLLDLVYLRAKSKLLVRTWVYVTFLAIAFLITNIHNSYPDQSQIPPWIKNSAKWWSQGLIGDSDFVKGLQYLLDKQMIKISTPSSLSNTQNQIPGWVKSNAGWWADGKIGDEDFVKGIQYLIQINIIQIHSLSIFSLSSAAFANNGTIPSQYTCDDSDVSPPLTMTGIPTNTKSLALIVDDVDAPLGIYTHWIIWNMTPDTSNFSAGEKIRFPQGITSAGTSGYHGPCPPSGSIHRYYFKLYALDSILNLDASSTKSNLENSMNGHIVAQATLIGKYSR